MRADSDLHPVLRSHGQQPQPVAIRSYVGLGVRLLAICESCWHVAELEIPALLNRLPTGRVRLSRPASVHLEREAEHQQKHAQHGGLLFPDAPPCAR